MPALIPILLVVGIIYFGGNALDGLRSAPPPPPTIVTVVTPDNSGLYVLLTLAGLALLVLVAAGAFVGGTAWRRTREQRHLMGGGTAPGVTHASRTPLSRGQADARPAMSWQTGERELS